MPHAKTFVPSERRELLLEPEREELEKRARHKLEMQKREDIQKRMAVKNQAHQALEMQRLAQETALMELGRETVCLRIQASLCMWDL